MFRVPEVTTAVLGVQTFIYIAAPGEPLLILLLEAGGFQLGADTAAVPLVGPYDAGQDVWWQLRETEGELFFETSPDAVTWTIRGQQLTPFALDDVEIALGAGAYQLVAGPGSARFRCYNTPPPCS